jgi:hypothetical protein
MGEPSNFEVFEKYGIKCRTIFGIYKSMKSILRQMRKRWSNYSIDEQIEISKELTGSDILVRTKYFE